MNDLLALYRSLGISEGDTVFIHANMIPFGMISENKAEYCEYFLEPLRKAVGEGGTISMLSYTFSYASGLKPYDHGSSPSEAGMLSEHLRTLSGTYRSFHPLSSIIATGKNARFMAEGNTRSIFGWGSPFHKLYELDAKLLYLGMTCGESCSFLHYVEQMYGVSHCYNKAFFHSAFREGKEVKGPFLAFLRHRSSKPYDFKPFEREMRSRGLIREDAHRGAPVSVFTAKEAFVVGMEMLEKDPCAFIEEPYYVTE